MTTLTSTNPNTTYTSLLTVGITGTGSSAISNGITGSIQTVQDGKGNNSALGISTAQVNCANYTFNGNTINLTSGNATFTPNVAFSGSVALNGAVTGTMLTLAGALTTSGAYTTTLTMTNNTTVTLPVTGTLSTLAGTETLTNKTLTSPVMTSPSLGTVNSGNISACTSTSMVMVTPVLGTPTSGVLTHCTGTAASLISGNTESISSAVGTIAGDNATAGNIGEVISSTILYANAVSLTTNTPANITSITLTPGDWDVHSGAFIYFSGDATAYQAGISTTSATFGDLALMLIDSAFVENNGGYGGGIPTQRFNVTTNTTIYLVAQCNFSDGTSTASGTILARRMR